MSNETNTSGINPIILINPTPITTTTTEITTTMSPAERMQIARVMTLMTVAQGLNLIRGENNDMYQDFNSIQMLTDQIFERKDVARTEFSNTKCNLQWQIAFKITYSKEVLDRCEEICYLCFDWTQYSAYENLNCLCSKPGKIVQAREIWMAQSAAKHQNKEYRTFPVQPFQYGKTQKENSEHEEEGYDPEKLETIPQDDCEFSRSGPYSSNVYSCITKRKLLDVALNPLKIATGKFEETFESDENTIFGRDILDNTIKAMKKGDKTEVSSSNRDLFMTALIGQALTQIRLTRIQNFRNLTHIEQILVKGFDDQEWRQWIGLGIAATSLTICCIYATMRITNHINRQIKRRDDENQLKGRIENTNFINERINRRRQASEYH